MKKIIVMDDSPTTLLATSSILTSAGYEVATTESPWIAAMVQRLRPHLALLDVHLGPGRSGLMVVESLARLRERHSMCVYLHSSLGADELQDHVEESGADGYIRKTGDREAFLAAVDQAISPARSLRRGMEALGSMMKAIHAATDLGTGSPEEQAAVIRELRQESMKASGHPLTPCALDLFERCVTSVGRRFSAALVPVMSLGVDGGVLLPRADLKAFLKDNGQP